MVYPFDIQCDYTTIRTRFRELRYMSKGVMLSTIPGQIPANVASECINDLDLQYIFNRDGKKKT